jgi:elongation factor Ts
MIDMALENAQGDVEGALKWLKTNARAKVEKPADPAAHGRIGSYVHHTGTCAATIHLACQTDFTARNAEFTKLADEIAMHIVAARPRWVSTEEAYKAIAEERGAQLERARAENVAADKLDRVVEGRVCSFVREHVLLDQTFVRDSSRTIGQMLSELSAKTGEPIVVRAFSRLEVGHA